MTIVNPDTFITQLDLGTAAKVTVSEERWPALSIVTVTPTTISLSAGRWLLTTLVNSIPNDIAAQPLTTQTDTTIASAGNLTPPSASHYVYRDIQGRNSTVSIEVTVQLRVGSTWVEQYKCHTTLTIPPVGTKTPQAHYGTNVHLFIPNPAGDAVSLRPYLDAIVASGGDTVVTSTPFVYLCPSSATFNVGVAQQIDTFYADCKARGLRVIATIQITCTETLAGWAGGTTANPWPASLTTVSDYVKAYLTRWAPAAIQIANEPNNGNPSAGSADKFMRVHTQAFVTAKATRPETLVYVGGLAFGDVVYLKACYSNGLAGKHDGIAIHPYDVRFDRGLAEIGAPYYPWERNISTSATLGKWLPAVHEIYKVMLTHGEGSKPVVITECGWSSSELAPNGLRCSEAQQAEYLAHGLRQMAHCPMLDTLVMYMAYDRYDTGVNRASWSRFGLVHPDGAIKPAFTAWTNTIAELKS